MAKAVLGPFAAATIMARDPAAAATAYVNFLGYQRVAISTTVPDDIAASWGAPAMAGRAMVSVRSESGNGAVLRFVQGEPVGSYAPFTTYGWNALEILTSDVDSLPAILEDSPFRIIGMPRDLYPSGAMPRSAASSTMRTKSSGATRNAMVAVEPICAGSSVENRANFTDASALAMSSGAFGYLFACSSPTTSNPRRRSYHLAASNLSVT